MSFNGYSNYETWCFCLWMDNNQCDQRFMYNLCKHGNIDDGSRASYVKEVFEQMIPQLGCNMWQDMLNASFGEIDWQEVVKQFSEGDEE